MDLWSSNLEETFRRLTSGETDLTGASRFRQGYQSSLNSGFTIKKPDGERMLADMHEKVTDVFRKNIEAVKVRSIKACYGLFFIFSTRPPLL